jgi:1,2-phenylacetyl-CoA epoxidase PaaB subunit
MKEPVYEVFARKTREEPLKHIGYINALNGELARVCAWTTYDEQNWFEMCVIPRSAILAVNLDQGPFAGGTSASDEIVHNTGTGAYGGSEVA